MTTDTTDHRFTTGLVYDIAKVLEQHGYHLPANGQQSNVLGRAVGVLHELVEIYEGRRDCLGNKLA